MLGGGGGQKGRVDRDHCEVEVCGMGRKLNRIG